MDAFFASVEQRCDPALRGRPVAVVGRSARTVVTAASYEAREYGVRTGMNRYEAACACPRLVFVEGDNRKYMDVSARIIRVIEAFSPLVEQYSIDEAFADVTGTEGLFGPPRALAASLKRRILEETGLTCSVGIGPNKLIAKMASGMEKPDGLVVVAPESVAALMEDLDVGELWGIGAATRAALATIGENGVRTCGELGRAHPEVLRRRFGAVGERLGRMGRGQDAAMVVPADEQAGPKSVGHSKTLARDLSSKRAVETEILKLSEKAGARMRRHGLAGRTVSLTLRYTDFHTFSRQRTLPAPTDDTREIASAACAVLGSVRLRSAVRLVGVTVSGITDHARQLPLFEHERRREDLLRAMDSVNGRFGDFTLTWGSIARSVGAPGVIPPSWRRSGVRRTRA